MVELRLELLPDTDRHCVRARLGPNPLCIRTLVIGASLAILTIGTLRQEMELTAVKINNS